MRNRLSSLLLALSASASLFGCGFSGNPAFDGVWSGKLANGAVIGFELAGGEASSLVLDDEPGSLLGCAIKPGDESVGGGVMAGTTALLVTSNDSFSRTKIEGTFEGASSVSGTVTNSVCDSLNGAFTATRQ